MRMLMAYMQVRARKDRNRLGRRDDMIRAGRHDELQGVTCDAHASQDAIRKEASESCA